MALPDQKPTPLPPGPDELSHEAPPAPEQPLSRQLVDWLGIPWITAPVDAVQGAVNSAGTWFQSHVLGMSPADEAAWVARQQDLGRQLEAHHTNLKDAASSDPSPARRLLGQVGDQLYDDYKPLWTVNPVVADWADRTRQDITARSAAMRAALPTAPVEVDWGELHPALRKPHSPDPLDKGRSTVDPLKPLDWAVGLQNDVIPNFVLGTVEGSTTPVGALQNVPLPAGAAAKLAGVLGGAGHLASMLPPELIERLFPALDKWGKPAGRLTGATILKRAEEAADLSPWSKKALESLATQVGERRVAPAEVHALAAGKAYTPGRVVRKAKAAAEGAKPIPGAPYDVTNARQARDLRDSYLRTMARGVEGRDWYHDAGGAIKFYANDDPVRANMLADDLSATSSATLVGANAGFGVKGFNQATAGVPIVTGRWPTAMGERIAEVHAGGEGVVGLKQDPFSHNLALGGDFSRKTNAPRAVHDIWDAEGHGYMNPDGTPMRTGFGPAQHRFMDAQQDKIIAAANTREVGGFTDWDELRTQAAQWVGRKIEAGEIAPENAAKSFADYFDSLVAQGSRETMPGRTTGHLPELFEPGMEEYRQLLHDIMTKESGIYDPEMRDQIAAGYGGLVGRAFPGPGLYKGEISPGMQTKVLTGSQRVPGGPEGARMLDEGSRRILDASEATYGLGLGQDAYAYSRLLPAGSGVARGLFDVTLPGGTITNAQMKALALRFPNIGDMAIIPTDEGVRLGFMDPDTRKAIIKMLGGTSQEAGVGLDTGLASGYGENKWDTHRAGQSYFDPIRTIGAEKFDAFAPGMFERIRKADALFRRETHGRFTMSQMLDEARAAVAGGGFADLAKLATKYGLPVTLLVAGLGELGIQVHEGSEAPDL